MTTWATLDDVLIGKKKSEKVQQGWSPQCDRQPAEPDHWGVLKTTAIQAGKFLDHENKNLPATLQPRPHLEVKAGDILMTCAGPRGRCGVPTYVRATREKNILSGKMYRFRPKPDLMDPRFLELYLLSPDAQRVIDGMKTGISDSGLNLTKDRFLGLKVPVFPLPEQQRIVEVLEDYISRLDAGVDYLDAAERRLGSLRRALLNDAFFPARQGEHDATASPADSPEGWRTVALPEVAAIQGGIQKQAKRHPVLNKFPFLRVANVTSTGLDLTEVHQVELFEGEIDKYRLCKGDLLVVEGNGSPDQIGRAAVWDGSIPDAVHQNHLIRVRPLDEIDPRYLGLVWNSPKVREYLSRVSSSSNGLHTLSVRKLRQVMIPLAPFADQQRIVATTEGRLSQFDLQAQHIAIARRRAASLRRSLLAAAFSGRLTGSASDAERIEEIAAETIETEAPEGVLF
ncbi:restriction endonuclease subunit S [Streptomyces sp. NPDC006516]|uniref:restriction endonuclease subunit S n=1 Tax=Streptomyces sp. NPDC006516 TaxID=3154309 RepID=UPI0033BA80D8